jgi:SWI/SNF-related matrix-associated actin-dependent regulator of chromatin subfamily A-like protein 1
MRNRARGVILADEMGLGKTVQALATLHAVGTFPAVIVCLASLKINWAREVEKWLPDRKVAILEGLTPYEVEADLLILNYDILHAWVDALPKPRAVVLDEAHYCKSPRARRTKASIALSDRVDPDGIVLVMTGTPVTNHPIELVSLLRICNRLDEFGGAGEFRRRYGTGSHLTELNRRLRSTCYVRRRKTDVLKDLPDKRWATITVAGDTEIMEAYREAELDVTTFLAQRARELAEEAGANDVDAENAGWTAAMRAQSAEHLVAITTLRRLAARAKMPAARAWISDFLTTGKKLVTFGWHVEVVSSIADEFANGYSVAGGNTKGGRQEAVDRFQQQDDQRVIACSIRSGGVGLTLTAASDALFLEMGWTPADMDQAVDRCHRIGQRDSVTGWVMVCEGTIDQEIAALIEQKRVIVDAATDGKAISDEASGVLGDLIVRLARKGLERGH